MAIQYPTTIVPESIDWRIQYYTQAYVSPFGGTTQTSEMPGARWTARMSFSNLQVSEQRELGSFLASLRGMSGRFILPDFSLPTPQLGSKADTTVVSATNTAVELANAAGLTVGDIMQVTPTPGGLAYTNSSQELKMITGINGTTVTVEPPFRVTPVLGDPVVFNNASCIMMLDTDDQAGWSASTAIYLSNMTISCMEAF